LKRRWTAAEIELLGKVPDVEIARRLGIAASTVAAEPQRRDIPSVLAPFEWTDEALALLGMDTDDRVAAVLGVSRSSVSNKRRELDIPSASGRETARGQPRADPFWMPERDALLGTESDAAIGRRLGISTGRVRRRRLHLGIPPAHVVARYDWTEVDPLLGRRYDREIAARFGMHEKAVRRRRLKLKIAAHRPERLPIRRDADLRRVLAKPAAEIGELPRSTLSELRKQLGVRPPPPRTGWTSEILERLGQEEDEVIAEELGLSVMTVTLKRRALGRLKRRGRR
jgi:transcriptional regulator with XRE-family HTH domain